MSVIDLRKRSLVLFSCGIVLVTAGAVINPFMPWIGLGFFLGGMALATAGLAMLAAGLGKENQDPAVVDEYQLTHIVEARAAALRAAYIGIGVLMTALLFVPLLVLASLSVETWAEVVRSMGMIAGGLVLIISYVQPFVIATRMVGDQRADHQREAELLA